VALDERDFMRERAKKEVESWKLSESEKEKRIREARRRFEAETAKHGGLTLRQRVRTNTGSDYLPTWPAYLIAIAIATGLFYYFNTATPKNLAAQQPATTKPVQNTPATVTTAQPIAAPALAVPPQHESVKERYWKKVYTVPTECKQERTAMKDLECRNREADAREQFERQWAVKLATGWKPREP